MLKVIGIFNIVRFSELVQRILKVVSFRILVLLLK